MGRKRQTILNQQEKREVEAYNLGNRLAERSCKNIGAKLLSEQMESTELDLLPVDTFKFLEWISTRFLIHQ